MPSELAQQIPWEEVLFSTIVVIVALTLRWLVVRKIQGSDEILSSEKRRWIATARNVTLLAIFFSLFLIWSLELAQFALSVAAFAVAIVIASKEIILCIAGGIYRTIVRNFEVGDWIKINDCLGEVNQAGVLSTTLNELSLHSGSGADYTGKVLVLPNAQLLVHRVENLSLLKSLVPLEFTVTMERAVIEPESDLEYARTILANEWKPIEQLSQRYWRRLIRGVKMQLQNPSPSVELSTTNLGDVVFRFKIYCPRKFAVDIESRVSANLLQHIADREMKERNSIQADEQKKSS